MKEYSGDLNGSGLKFAIIASRYNDFITRKLVDGALHFFKEHGVAEEHVAVFWCPGALEVPAVAARIAAQGVHNTFFDGLVCVGCVIRGETDHYTHVSTEAIRGVSDVARQSHIAVGNAVLTVENAEQAMERSGTKNMNKGWEAASAALEQASLFKMLK